METSTPSKSTKVLKEYTFNHALSLGYREGFVYTSGYKERVTFRPCSPQPATLEVTDRFGVASYPNSMEHVWIEFTQAGETLPSKVEAKAELARLGTVVNALSEVVRVMAHGDVKHPANDWRIKGTAGHLNAATRHILRADKLDDESGLEHAAHAVCRLLYYLEIKLDEATRASVVTGGG